MQIVIDIPKTMYDWLINGFSDEKDGELVIDAIKHGTVLPKNHGRLIDADDLRCENADFDTYNDYCLMFDEIDEAPTVLEADKENEGQ